MLLHMAFGTVCGKVLNVVFHFTTLFTYYRCSITFCYCIDNTLFKYCWTAALVPLYCMAGHTLPVITIAHSD